VTIDKTRRLLLKYNTRKHAVEVKNKSDDAGVEKFAAKELDEFVESVSKYADQTRETLV